MSERPQNHPISVETKQKIIRSLIQAGQDVTQDIEVCGGVSKYCDEISDAVPRSLKTVIYRLVDSAFPPTQQSEANLAITVQNGFLVGLGLSRGCLDENLGSKFGKRLETDLRILDEMVLSHTVRADISHLLPRHFKDEYMIDLFDSFPDSLFELFRDDVTGPLFSSALSYVAAGVAETLLRDAIQQA